jgi:hypothetical protein
MKTFAILIALAVAASAQLVPQTQLQADLSTIAKAADGTTYYGERRQSGACPMIGLLMC